MPVTHFGPLTALGGALNTVGNLLEQTWGIASFPTPTQINGNYVFCVSGSAGLTVRSLLANGNILELDQAVVDTPESLMSQTGLDGIEVFRQGGKSWLIGINRNEAALNVFEINVTTGLLTFASAVAEPLTMATSNSVTQLRVGS